jgi:hypothetical protein
VYAALATASECAHNNDADDDDADDDYLSPSRAPTHDAGVSVQRRTEASVHPF